MNGRKEEPGVIILKASNELEAGANNSALMEGQQ